MVCFCFRSNKVSPTKGTELPDILAVPETTNPQAAATAGTEATGGHEPEVNSDNLSSPGDATAVEQSAVSELPAVSEEITGSGDYAIFEETTSYGDGAICEESAICGNHAISDENDQSEDKIAVPIESTSAESCVIGATENESARNCEIALESSAVGKSSDDKNPALPISQTSSETSLTFNVTKRTFGRFDVYSTSDDDKDAGTDMDAATSDVKAVSQRRPLVILIPWLNARKRHIHKYSRLYVDKGMDVLLVRLTPLQILRPLRSKTIARELLDLLQKEGFLAERPLIVHGFSVGAFVWGQLLLEMNGADNDDDNNATDVLDGFEGSLTTIDINDDTGDNCKSSTSDDKSAGPDNRDATESGSQAKPRKSKQKETSTDSSNNTGYSTIHQRVVCVVMDSPAPAESILKGIPNSLSNSTIIRTGIRHLLASYIRLFPHSVARHYTQGEEAVDTNVAKHPMLILYSSADVVVSSEKLDELVEAWRKRGAVVHVRKWNDSAHVDHFRPHSEEYKEDLRQFLESAGLSSSVG